MAKVTILDSSATPVAGNVAPPMQSVPAIAAPSKTSAIETRCDGDEGMTCAKNTPTITSTATTTR
jgi:hypothetical protein